jgi:CheY-like chemotaxis protein
MTTILVVDDSAVDQALVGQLLGKRSDWQTCAATNGIDALAQITSTKPDLVVTDLQMPQMNGLELVTAIRRQHPGVPVILMTAYGSEAIAVEALEKGASSYVPKSELPDKLVNTVEKVLATARAERSYEQLIHSMTDTRFSLRLGNDTALIDPLVDLVQQMVVGVGFCDAAGRLQIGMALKEALINALFHGSLELPLEQMHDVLDKVRRGEQVTLVKDPRSDPAYRDRSIFVTVNVTPDEVRLVVRDEGPGFDVKAVPKPRDPGALEAGHGRGLTIIYNLMDEVTFNDAGNEVTMVKRRAAAPAD